MITIDLADFDSQVQAEEKRLIEAVKNGLRRAGEKYVETARQNGSYSDHTKVLRNSNGYGIAEKGVLTEVHGNETWSEGVKNEDLSGELILECGAGADYSSHVQRKGYDVSDTGQLAAENEIRRQFNDNK